LLKQRTISYTHLQVAHRKGCWVLLYYCINALESRFVITVITFAGAP